MPNQWFTVGLVALAARSYTALAAADLWPCAFQIMPIAGAIYTFIIQRFETKETRVKTPSRAPKRAYGRRKPPK
jgi:hypothetical protein